MCCNLYQLGVPDKPIRMASLVGYNNFIFDHLGYTWWLVWLVLQSPGRSTHLYNYNWIYAGWDASADSPVTKLFFKYRCSYRLCSLLPALALLGIKPTTLWTTGLKSVKTNALTNSATAIYECDKMFIVNPLLTDQCRYVISVPPGAGPLLQ